MVLDKLSSSLKESLKKLAKSIFLDERAINEFVKEIQKALLKADVNVQLVFDLTSKIKERALKEVKEGNREKIIKIVYEELVEFLGREKSEIKIEKKPFKIMFVGIYGSGKCIHAKSNVLLGNGNIIPVEEIYDLYSGGIEEDVEDGKIIDISDKNLYVPSFNKTNLKIENRKVTHLWKLEKEDLIEVKLDNGNDFLIKVTPEHPFFVLRNGQVIKVRADELVGDDYIAIPREYKIDGKLINLFNQIKQLDLFVYLDPKIAKKLVLKKYNTLLEANKALKFSKNYCKFTTNVKNGKIPIQFLDETMSNVLTVKYNNAKDKINIPLFLTSEFSEFLGYVIGDGHIDNNGVDISNENPEIINRVVELSKSLFNINPTLKRDMRTKKMYRILISSTTLVEILKLFYLKPGKKGKNLRIPKQVLLSKEDAIKSFIRAYFDCDSYPRPDARYIELSSESRILIQQTSLLLRRLGILSTISKKFIDNIPYWRLTINSRYAEIYANKIGYLIKSKQQKVSKYRNIGILQGCGKQDMIPVGNSLNKLRLALGFSLAEIQRNAVNSYDIYEKKGLISREMLVKLLNYYFIKGTGQFYDLIMDIYSNKEIRKIYSNPFLNGILPHLEKQNLIINQGGDIVLTHTGEEVLQLTKTYNLLENVNNLLNLSNSNVCWLPIKEINRIKNDEKFVYDMTVGDNHSFIADGFVVHNTTTIGKLARYYSKRGYKVATLALDVYRPAAFEQLRQVSEEAKVKSFIFKDKDPVKIYKKFEKELNDFDIVLIDTAGRDALSKDLIEEISLLNKEIKPNEKILVMSADIGQAAKNLAEGFHNSCGVTGIIITKLDGTAKGGGALTGASVTGAKVKFIGLGEKLDDLEVFNPPGFVSRMLGMGDIEALLEKFEIEVSKEQAEDLGKKLLKGEFNFVDLYEQMQTMKKLGPLNKIVEMIPGFGSLNIPKEMFDVQEGKIDKWKHMMNSMTKKELEDPEIITTDRMARIANGSGTTTAEVRELLKQYKQSKKMMKMLKGKDPSKLMKKFGNLKLK